MQSLIDFLKKPEQFLLLAMYVFLNGALMYFSTPNASYIYGGDANAYVQPALGLLQLGSFVDPSTPDIPYTFGTPLYSVFLAFFFGVFPWEQALFLVVCVQIALLYMTALMTRTFIYELFPKAAVICQALLLFNPNSLITTHLIQTETIFTFLFILTCKFLWDFGHTGRLSQAASAGFLVGVTALVRPVGLYTIVLLPIAFGLLILFPPGALRFSVKKIAQSAGIAVIAAIVTISPWYARNYYNFNEFFFTTNAGPYLHDQYLELLQAGHGMTIVESVEAAQKLRDDFMREKDVDENTLSSHPNRKNLLLVNVYKDAILDQPLLIHCKALIRSWARLFLSGGASNFRNYLGFEGQSLHQIFQQEKWQGILSALELFWSRLHGEYLFLVVITLGYAVTSRMFGLIGLGLVFKEHNARFLGIILVGQLFFFTAMYIYLGIDRFRVPLEPALAILASLGFVHVQLKLKNN